MLFLSVLFLSILLVGCISIPLGDGGKLEVSKDGVNVDLGEESAVDEIEVDDEDVEDSESEEEAVETEDAEEGVEEGSDTTNGANGCIEEIEDSRGNERSLKQLAELAPPDFPLPDCTKVDSVVEDYYDGYQAVTVDSYFVVEGYWADIFDLYEEYLVKSGFEPLKKSEKAEEKSGWIEGKTPDYDVTLNFNQVNREDSEELVNVRVIIYHYDTPRDE